MTASMDEAAPTGREELPRQTVLTRLRRGYAIIVLGLVAAAFHWVWDASVHAINHEQTFLKALVAPAGDDLGLRLFGSALIIGAAILSQLMLDRSRAAERALLRANDELEERVGERTAELTDANTKLKREIAERERMERILEHLAYHDPLTDLPNRALLNDRLDLQLASSAQDGEAFAVLFAHVDRLAVEDDGLGRAATDTCLVEMAERLSTTLREGDTIARYGGDDFALLLPGVSSREQAGLVAEKMLFTSMDTVDHDGTALSCVLSIGVALWPDNGATTTDLLHSADLAMAEARRIGGGWQASSASGKVRSTRPA